MAIPELDLKKVNLQAAVGYLISLHDNEVDWNLLGIKVIGQVKTEEDIPAGDYEYGDAYEVGTEPPYDLYIYTRPDGTVHTEGYWFPVGKFPMPGPQGPKGDGLEQIMSGGYGNIQSVQYDTAHGAQVNGTATINYVDSTTGMPTSKSFLMASEMPIVPGKYVSIATTSDKKNIEVKVDDTKLALDYWKIKKTVDSAVPLYKNGTTDAIRAVREAQPNTLAKRDSDGDIAFNRVGINFICGTNFQDTITQEQLARTVIYTDNNISEVPSDSGVLNNTDYIIAKNYQNTRILYKNKLYYCMDPRTAPDGTLNFIHLDSIDDGNGGHKATGKCFSINVSTKEWKVFDLDFGGSTSTTDIYRHGIVMNDANIVVKLDIYDNNSHNYTYEQLKAKLALNPAHCANARIKRSDNTYYYSPATIKYWNDSTGDFVLTYNNTEGNSVNVNWTPSVVADNGTQIL